MNGHRLALATCVLLSMLLGAAAQAQDYPCVNAREGQGQVRVEFRQTVLSAIGQGSAADQEKVLLAKRGEANSDAERSIVDLALGSLYADTGRQREAAAAMEPLLKDPYLSRSQLDIVHTTLALIATDAKDYDKVIALLEPVYRAHCAPIPDRANFLLAYAYLARKRGGDALQVLDNAHIATAPDPDFWEGVQSELRCKADGPAICVNWIASIAKRGGLSPALTDVLNTLLGRVVADPAAATALGEAQGRELIDGRGRIVPRPRPAAEDVAPVTRIPAPVYPARALRDGISGFVRIRLEIGIDGNVSEATVIDASPKGYFEESALAAVRKWTYRPKTLDGRPIISIGIQDLMFSIPPERR